MQFRYSNITDIEAGYAHNRIRADQPQVLNSCQKTGSQTASVCISVHQAAGCVCNVTVQVATIICIDLVPGDSSEE
jgi:hypothetical protein